MDDFPPGGCPEYLTEVNGAYYGTCYWTVSGFFSSSCVLVAHGESLL